MQRERRENIISHKSYMKHNSYSYESRLIIPADQAGITCEKKIQLYNTLYILEKECSEGDK